MENNKNQILTSKAIALIFSESSFVNPKGKLSLSINNLMLITNITIPPMQPKAKPNPDDLPKDDPETFSLLFSLLKID